MSTTNAPDPRRFAGLSLAECIELIEAEAADEIAAEADAYAADCDSWDRP